MKDKKEVRKKQNGFSKDKTCLTDLITFYDKTTCSVHKRGKQRMPLLQQSSGHSFLQSMPLMTFEIYGLDGETAKCAEKWLDLQTQKAVVNG